MFLGEHVTLADKYDCTLIAISDDRAHFLVSSNNRKDRMNSGSSSMPGWDKFSDPTNYSHWAHEGQLKFHGVPSNNERNTMLIGLLLMLDPCDRGETLKNAMVALGYW